MNELVTAAQEYIGLGLRVIALTGKQPNTTVHPHGLFDALPREEEPVPAEDEVVRLFTHPRTTGIGILTCYPNFVVDIDGEAGAQAWKDIVGEDDYIPDRWCAKTGRGLHLWFRYEGPVHSYTLTYQLDLKGAGGYVAAPPSVHPDGGKYEWLSPPGDDVPLEPPEGLLRYLGDKNRRQERLDAARKKGFVIRSTKGGIIYATTSLEGVFRVVRNAPRGERNNTLNWAAYRMAQGMASDEDYEKLKQIGIEAGLNPREIEATIRSARKGFANDG